MTENWLPRSRSKANRVSLASETLGTRLPCEVRSCPPRSPLVLSGSTEHVLRLPATRLGSLWRVLERIVDEAALVGSSSNPSSTSHVTLSECTAFHRLGFLIHKTE